MEWYDTGMLWIEGLKSTLKAKFEAEMIPKIIELGYDYNPVIYDYLVNSQTRRKIMAFELEGFEKQRLNDQEQNAQTINMDFVFRIHNTNIANREDENNDHIDLLNLVDNYITSELKTITTSTGAVWFDFFTGQGQTNVYWVFGGNYGAELHFYCKTNITIGE